MAVNCEKQVTVTWGIMKGIKSAPNLKMNGNKELSALWNVINGI